MAERGRPDLAAVGLVGAVGDEIDAELALGAFGRDIYLAGGDVIALGVELEVVDQRFHRLLHLGALGREHLAVEAADRAFGHVAQALAHDPRRLPHFLDPDHEAVVAIALACRPECRTPSGHRLRRAGYLRRSHGMPAARIIGPREAPGDGVFLADRADVDVALLEDAVVGDQADRILEHASGTCRGRSRCLVEHLRRNVLVDPADAEVIGVHPRARHRFVELHRVLADLEQPQVRGHRADVHDVAAEVEHVVRDARQFRHQHADILRAQRHLEPHQFLDREHVAMLHAHRRAIIEPVEVRQRLGVGLIFDQFLGAAVEQADMRIDPLDDLAVQLHDQAQHAMRGGMLRAEVDRVILDGLVAAA